MYSTSHYKLLKINHLKNREKKRERETKTAIKQKHLLQALDLLCKLHSNKTTKPKVLKALKITLPIEK